MSFETYRQTAMAWTRAELRNLRLEYRTEAEDEPDPERARHRDSLSWAVSYLYGDLAGWLPDDGRYADMEDLTVEEYIDQAKPVLTAERVSWTDGAANTAALALRALAGGDRAGLSL